MRTGRHLAGRARIAVALALACVQAILLLVPIQHAAHEQRSSTVASNAPSLGPSCPDGCKDPGHSHHPHDAATCATCQASRVVFVLVRFGAPAMSSTLVVEGRTATHPVARALLVETSSPRGPPAPTLVA
jgi:hypothetical protein